MSCFFVRVVIGDERPALQMNYRLLQCWTVIFGQMLIATCYSEQPVPVDCPIWATNTNKKAPSDKLRIVHSKKSVSPDQDASTVARHQTPDRPAQPVAGHRSALVRSGQEPARLAAEHARRQLRVRLGRRGGHVQPAPNRSDRPRPPGRAGWLRVLRTAPPRHHLQVQSRCY